MKNNRFKNSILLICVTFMAFSFTNVNAKTKKPKARLKVQFYKEGTQNILNISAKYKEGRKFKMAKGLDLKVYSIIENDSLVFLGNATLNNVGKFVFNVNKAFEKAQDIYTFKVIHKESKKFKKTTKTIEIKIANLVSKLNKNKDNYSIEATLTDANNEPIAGQELKVQLQRLFSPLTIGTEINFTDDNGTIVVPIKEIMPGINGKLNYQVVLEDSDDYGTIKSVVSTNIGKPIKDLSTFDQRTMWSPPTKAPWADLIIPNLLILGIWGTLVILVINLFKISKNKNS
jgi:hypothetical protein